MNEENNQNTPILGASGGGEGGGEIVPTSNFPSGTYKIKFSDEYYQGPNNANEQIKGRIMLLQNDDINGGNYFVINRIICDDTFVDEYVSHFDTESLMPGLGRDFFGEHSGIMQENIILDYEMVGRMFGPRIEYHFVLDEEWYNKHYGEDSNKVLRTFATGQSDITRHEAYTKAQGLNWANASVPNYVVADKFNGHEYVDLGLPSGTLWAKMNVGAESETDYGLYFAWGETVGYTVEQVSGSTTPHKDFSWNDYGLTNDSGSTMSKYTGTDGDGKTVLDAEDDAANVNMGGEWHMPTNEQCEELFNTEYVTNEWVENYNGSSINGYLFTSVSNGNTLFIPAAGDCLDGKVYGVGECGYVWSSSLYADNVYGAQYFGFGSDGSGVNGDDRCYGRSVRGVIGEIEEKPK